MLLKNALLSAPDGLVESSDDLYFYFSRYHWSKSGYNPVSYHEDRDHRRFLQLRITKGLPSEAKNITMLRGKYISSLSPYIHSYYHFLSELLDTIALNPNVPVLIGSDFPSKFLEFLKFIKVPTILIDNEVFKVNFLIVPNYVRKEWNYEKLQRVKDFINAKVPNLNTGKNKENITHSKIYISRKFAKRRHIINEEEIFERLNKQGYKLLHLENINIIEQIKIFRSCKEVSGPHGAGLTNIINMPEGSRLIEYRPVLESGNGCFDNLASLCKVKHDIVISKSENQFLI